MMSASADPSLRRIPALVVSGFLGSGKTTLVRNLLADAQNVQSIAQFPWILAPGVFIFVTIMSFNFLGDYLRDTLDPRSAGVRG